MFLPETSIRKPVTTFMMMAAIMVFGIIGFSRLGIDQFPKVDFPTITVTTIIQGASPDVVEENITDIIEEEVATLEGVKNITSISSHGASVVTVEFNLDRDIDIAAQDVRDKVSGVLRRLPPEADPPSISKLDLQAQPIMWVAISGDRPIQDITHYATEVLKPKFETVNGVGAITVGGRRERAVRIWLDRTKIESRGISSDDVVNALLKENVELPGGFLKSKDIEFSVKVEGEFEKVEHFNDLIVANVKGTPVKIRDIARVEDGLEDKRNLARYKGDSAVGLGIRKKAGANTVEVATLVKQEIEKAKKDLPTGLKLDVAFDGSVFIEESIEEMEFALIFGGILAAVVVFFFLKNPRATIITGLAIPLSIIGTFFFIYFFGFTLNTMTMLALTLAVGVVIDDAIIVIESIYRYREEGLGLVEAARKGASEIAFAAMATSFALAAVFIPVAFMKGVIGRFFFEFGITVAIAIFISLFVALTFTPMLSSKFLKIEYKNRVFDWIEGNYKRLEDMYARVLGVALNKKILVIAVAAGLFAGSLFIWKILGKELVPPEDQSRFMIAFEAPIGSSIEYTNSKLQFIEKNLKDVPEIRSYFTAIGLGESTGVHKGIAFVRMFPKKDRKRTQDQVVAELRKKLNVEPGLRVYINTFNMMFGGGRGPQLEYYIKGPSLEELDKYASIIQDKFSKIPGVVGVKKDYDVGLPELKLIIDRDRASDLGVDATTLARSVYALVGGQDVTSYKEGGKRYDVRVKLDEGFVSSPSDVEKLTVRNKSGAIIKIDNFITAEEGAGPSVINRRDRERSIAITANLENGKTLGSAIEDISKIAGETLPEGFTTLLGGSAEQFKETVFSMLFAFFLATVITYMILGSLFESFAHPFTVMLALPLSIIGALGGLLLTGNTINIYSMIGITLLIGLVTKNSILLVDYTNRKREEGVEIYEALKMAGAVRLRPILMTLFSTVFGVLPTAIGIGPGSESRAPMAIATIGGLLTSTFLTLFVIPVAYIYVDWLRNRFSRSGR